eukprot:jgi/Botrbrau1/2742/Bobra.0164s0022.1
MLSLVKNTEALQKLESGASRLGLPRSTALELFHFLFVKRIHDKVSRHTEVTTRFLRMDPSPVLDTLWRHMLLNTEVADHVHELLGGTVRRDDTEENDPSVSQSNLLYSMNLMEKNGFPPAAELWQVPGLRRTSYVCDFLDSEDLSSTNRQILVEALSGWVPGLSHMHDLYTEGPRQSLGEWGRSQGTRSRAPPSVGEAEHPPNRQAAAIAENPVFYVFVKTLTRETIRLAAHRDMTVFGLKCAVQDKQGIPVDQQRLIFTGMHMDDHRLLADYGVLPEAIIFLALRLSGC